MVAFKTRGGHVEVLENCCPLVEYPNEQRFAEKIVELLMEEEKYKELQRRALERVKEFSSERIAERYLTLFEELLSSKI